jgi:hypothetical protein
LQPSEEKEGGSGLPPELADDPRHHLLGLNHRLALATFPDHRSLGQLATSCHTSLRLKTMSASLPGPLRSLFARSPGPLCPDKAQQHLPEPLDLGSVPLAAQPGLHLLNSDWNAAHLCAQAHEGEQSGIFDLWHAIAHRTGQSLGAAAVTAALAVAVNVRLT